MLTLPTAVLLHTTADGEHHDWLIVDPNTLADPDAPLWTARVAPSPSEWASVRRFTLTPLPPHRRIYLHYEGPISGNRGHVRRVGEGHVLPLVWTDRHLVLDVHLRDFVGRLELHRLSAACWQAQVESLRGSELGE